MTTFTGQKCYLCDGVLQTEGHINNCPELRRRLMSQEDTEIASSKNKKCMENFYGY